MRPCSHHWSDYCEECGKVKAPEPVVEKHDWKNVSGRDLAVKCAKCGLETANNDVSMNMMDSAYLCPPKASAVDKMLGSSETLHKEGETRTVGAEVALERDQLKKTVAELREIVAALEEHIKFIYNK